MNKPGILVSEAKRRIVEGSLVLADPHIAQQLRVTLESINEYSELVQVVFHICDKDGQPIVELCRLDLHEGDTGTIMNIDNAFNITLSS